MQSTTQDRILTYITAAQAPQAMSMAVLFTSLGLHSMAADMAAGVAGTQGSHACVHWMPAVRPSLGCRSHPCCLSPAYPITSRCSGWRTLHSPRRVHLPVACLGPETALSTCQLKQTLCPLSPGSACPWDVKRLLDICINITLHELACRWG